jgi:hypothetical protein
MNIPWNPFVFLQAPDFIKSSLAPRSIVDVVIPGSGQPIRVTAKELDVECLRLFPRGTMMLMQIEHGALVDWTLCPQKDLGHGYTLPGDEWKDG